MKAEKFKKKNHIYNYDFYYSKLYDPTHEIQPALSKIRKKKKKPDTIINSIFYGTKDTKKTPF